LTVLACPQGRRKSGRRAARHPSVFRNQIVLVGESQAEVFAQGKDYIALRLGLKPETIDDAISVRQQGKQYTGALRYSYLADLVTGADAGPDVQRMDLKEFEGLMGKEDAFDR
jgi:hypothetical protein